MKTALLAFFLLAIAISGWFVARETRIQQSHPSSGVDRITAQVNFSRQKDNRFPIEIRKPPGPPRVATGQSDFHGVEITVSCSTCHSTREPNSGNKFRSQNLGSSTDLQSVRGSGTGSESVAELDEFHKTLKFSHGSVSCLSCHNPNDYDSLKLADGTRIEFTDVMTLCAQCHGQQMKDFEHGAHGGMNGYWDLSRGPRIRNNCVDCHNPHSPQFPKMQPTFKPKDRFLEPNTEH